MVLLRECEGWWGMVGHSGVLGGVGVVGGCGCKDLGKLGGT